MTHLRLADFGSASSSDENEIAPYLVSRFYRAPEIILGLPYSYEIDVWSVACTLYELCTGKILFPGHDNNEMIKLIMEVKGKFPNKLLKRAMFRDKYFDENLNFCLKELDPVTQSERIRILTPSSTPTVDLQKMLGSHAGPYVLFKDFLDKLLILDPAKRMTVREALHHPFVCADPGKKI
eukprot:GCRY01003280.1.p1 GENE.GCRY01003280.1~~GCRY01003280.1.p1  ORF type:complete len:180 (-),score=40.28 GCRY01003280.1:278-817(-)